MTSEAFVYLMLPETTELVAAGRFVLATDRAAVPIGRFVYRRTYLQRHDAVPQAHRFLLERGQASRIVDELEACVRARWYAIARREGVSERDCEQISRAFVYEGFRYSPG